MGTNSLTPLQEKTNTLKTLLNRESFYQELCSYSNNNINEVITNLSKIIFYYLYSNDSNIDYSLESLFTKITYYLNLSETYIIYPTNTFYYNEIKLLGLNNSVSFTKKTNFNLEKLSSILSAYPENIKYSLQAFTNIKEALKASFFSPSIVYRDILKQPINQEQPIIIGESKEKYYESILKTRLSNTLPELYSTASQIAKKTIPKIIAGNPLLVIFKSNLLTPEEKNTLEINSYINPSYLSFIKLPSYYDLLTICALNNGLTQNTKIDINTGEYYKEPKKEKINSTRYTYNRYELVSVTSSFLYINDEVTGDPFYDIDKIYGILNTDKSRDALSKSFSENIATIKQSANINVKKRKDKYLIQNGRHRLIYLKYYYLSNYEYYQKIGRLDLLKEKVTIPMLVEHQIEDQEFTNLLDELKKITSFTLIKSDTRNDNLEFFIILPNYVYYITSSKDLNNLYKYLKNKNYNNEYLISYNISEYNSIYEEVIRYLIITLKEDFSKLSFYELIKYLKNNQNIQSKFQNNFKTLNINLLYIHYNNYLSRFTTKEFFNPNKDVIAEVKKEIEETKIGTIIMDYLKNNPQHDLSWDNIYQELIKIPSLSSYSSKELRECADKEGYHHLLLSNYYQSLSKKKKQ